jgi:hypothetical protein
VPSNFKFLKLKDPPKPKKPKDGSLMAACGPCCFDDSESDEKPIQPGRLDDIQMLFTEKTAALKLLDDHSEITIYTKWAGDQRLPYRGALLSLVRDHGFPEPVAREMLKTAAAKHVASYRVRYAPGFGDARSLVKRAYAPNVSMLDGGPNAPPPMPPQYGMEQMGRTAVRSQYPDETHQLVPALDSTIGDMRHRNMWQNYTYEDFQKTMQQAQEAGQSGQKEVFDTAMIQGMLKSVRQDSLVDRYLGDLMKALDKLGRILFMFYWHGEEFEDRYGKADLPELEDSLRNSFESLGDVTLFLKEKTVEPNFNSATPESEPDVEETARV